MVTTPLPSVSILYCTFRPGGLDVLFSALAAQTYRGEMELILVDDHHDDARRREAAREAHARWPFPGDVAHLANPGGRYPKCSSASARNQALRHAAGDLSIWLGDNCSVRSDFVAQHVTAHYLGGRDDLVVTGSQWNVGVPRFAPEVDARDLRHDDERLFSRVSLFAEPATPGVVQLLPITRGQDKTALDKPDCVVDYHAFTMKNDSLHTRRMRDIGGFDERLDDFDSCLCQDTEMALRLGFSGCRFLLTKRCQARVVIVRSVMQHIRAPWAFGEWQAVVCHMDETHARCVRGDYGPSRLSAGGAV